MPTAELTETALDRKKALYQLLFAVDDDGYEACIMGGSRDECPYRGLGPEIKLLRRKWLEGFDQAQSEAEDD